MHRVPSTSMTAPPLNSEDGTTAVAPTSAAEAMANAFNSDNEADYVTPSPRKLFDVAGRSRVSIDDSVPNNRSYLISPYTRSRSL